MKFLETIHPMMTLLPHTLEPVDGCFGRDISEKQQLNLNGKGPTKALTSQIAVKLQDIEHVSMTLN